MSKKVKYLLAGVIIMIAIYLATAFMSGCWNIMVLDKTIRCTMIVAWGFIFDRAITLINRN